MKKTLLLVGTLAISFLSAQNNAQLKQKFAEQNRINQERYEALLKKRAKNKKTDSLTNKIWGQKSKLSGFLPNGIPYFYHETDVDQNTNSNSDFLQNGTVNGLTGSYNGENIKFTVFDGGKAYENHELFNNMPNRIDNKEADSIAYNFHATGVTGFIGAKDHPATITVNGVSKNVNYKGIAPNSTFENYSFQTTVLPGNTNTSSVMEKILIAEPKISNHSYGSNLGWQAVYGGLLWIWRGSHEAPFPNAKGTYLDSDQNYDEIVYNNPSYIIVKAAGNEFGGGPGNGSLGNYYVDPDTGDPVAFPSGAALPPNDCAEGYDCIGTGSLAKNIIVVGATDIISANGGRYTASSDVVHSVYSSAGPRDDGGIKPDITATGTDVVHASTSDTGSTEYDQGSGTSYSSPVVTGIIGLWTQINKQLFNGAELNAASAKTLMIHSSSEAGNVGPDPLFGWGYIDAKKGAELLVEKSNNTIIFDDEALNSGVVNSKIVKAEGNKPLKVTVSWVDPESSVPDLSTATWNDIHNNRTSKLVNDLDVRIVDTETNTVYFPWRLDADNPLTPAIKGDNTVDNVEQVVLDNPVAGRNYRVEISNKGNLVNNAGGAAPQNYSIIVSGFSENVLGTKDVNIKSDIIIAPTLTKGSVKILKAPARSEFAIYDLSGKKLQNGKVNSHEMDLDLSSYANGIYIVEVKTEKGNISKRVIKQ
ncbi:S8 family peptidase [Chryseobacterium aureum]|uniref:S8 family peptidase n=1 Tax=Chryseobacterium aureum TaxID=2497456 RepID=UPI000F88AAAF|nr:S8 family peptidase [Chryseobacterium aureum]